MRAVMTEELFNDIIEHLSSSSDNLHKVLDKFNTTTYMFYGAIGSDTSKSERYMQARSKYIENKLSSRSKIMEDAIAESKIHTKCANALIAAAKEQCRIIEWDCEKLLPKIYGGRLDNIDGSLKIVMVNQNVAATTDKVLVQ